MNKYFLIAFGGDYDRNIDIIEEFTLNEEEKLKEKIKELLGLESPYFKGGLIDSITIIYGHKIKWFAEKELVKEIKISHDSEL